MPIEPLSDTSSSDTKRTYIDALIQVVPWVGGSISTIIAHHWPYAGEREIRQKVDDLCEIVNQLESALKNTNAEYGLSPRLTALSVLIARFLCKQGDHYLSGSIETQPLFAEFAEFKKTEIEDALVELIKQGFLEESAVLQYRFKYVVRQPQLFFVFDPDVYGWFPAIDASYLGDLMVNHSELGNAAKLDAHVGWPRRRLNAALLFLKTVVFDDRHYSKTLQAEYPSSWFQPGPEERYELRMLKESLQGSTEELQQA